MCVGAVGSGSSGIDPILIERYAVINKQLRLRRIKKEEKIEPLRNDDFKVKTYENTISPEELREIYANPILSHIPIKVAYTILQRVCNETLKASLCNEYLKPLAIRMYEC